MKFKVRFKIGNRFGAASKYSLREFCLSLVESFSLTDKELATIVSLEVGESFENDGLRIEKVKAK